MSPPTVVYVAGWSRSGSTLLDAVLGAEGGWFSCGELRLLWVDLVCGCGTRVSRCSFWSAILERLLPRHGLDFASAGALYREAVRPGPWTLAAALRARSGSSEAVRRYSALLADLYAEIGSATGARVLVDSSKAVPDALLAQMGGGDLRVVHLIRDPRATAWSWSKRKPSFEPGSFLPKMSPTRSSINWTRTNVLVESLLRPRHAEGVLRIRYEDFCRSPAETVEKVCRLASASESRPLASHRFELGPNHMAGGNTVRFQRGEIEIAVDRSWRTEMGAAAQAQATLPALPLMARYGYRLAPLL